MVVRCHGWWSVVPPQRKGRGGMRWTLKRESRVSVVGTVAVAFGTSTLLLMYERRGRGGKREVTMLQDDGVGRSKRSEASFAKGSQSRRLGNHT